MRRVLKPIGDVDVDNAPAPVVRRVTVGAVDDTAEREADDVSAVVTSLLDRPALIGAPQAAATGRIRRRPEAPMVRRKLTEVADNDDVVVVKEHLNVMMDTGRSFFDETRLIFRLNELLPTPDAHLKATCGTFARASKGSDATALHDAINALAVEANGKYDGLMTSLSTLRDATSDTSDALTSHFKEAGMTVGKDEQMLETASVKLRQAVFKTDPLAFVIALYEFREWLKPQEYKWYYDEFESSNKKAIAEDKSVDTDKPTPGIVTLAELRKVAPMGTTGGQRYTPDRTHGAYRYHVSISFKIIDTKANLKLSPTKKKVEISNFHVSFEPAAGGKVFYWWRQQGKKGNYVFNNVAGDTASGTVGMQTAADTAVTNAAAGVNCTA